VSKLFKLKEWLTLEEAANHIANLLGESVTLADLYRLSLDGHLTLSVNFVNGAEAILGKMVKSEDVQFYLVENDFLTKEKLEIPWRLPSNNEIRVADDDWISLDEKVVSIHNVWDLTMLGSEAIDIEFYYQQMTSGLEVTLVGLEGVFLKKDDVIAQLQTDYDDNEFQMGSKANKLDVERFIIENEISEDKAKVLWDDYKTDRVKYLKERESKKREDNYFPSGGLGEHDYVFVIRTNELNRFIKSLEDTPPEEKALTSKERNSLLVLIGALCKEVNIDPKQRGVAASLVAMTELVGAPLTDDTIRKILSQIEPAIDSRSK
jgi:hypothetical protein